VPELMTPSLDALRARVARANGDFAGADFVLGSSEGPLYDIARARSALARRVPERACALLEGLLERRDVPSTVRVEAAVLRSIAAVGDDQPDGARLWIERALDLAEADAIRKPFTDSGPEVASVLRMSIRYGTAHRWLAGSLLAVLDGRQTATGHGTRELLDPLSVRETIVLRYLPTLLSNQEIAGELFVSVNTVKTHLKSIYRKLGVSDRREAVRLAQELRLVG
jgi:LuxR family transcriptional regulator, maltose regulon positive regulatory protein